MQVHERACSSLSLHEVPWAYMKFHELACSFMSLYAVSFFVWAAHKNFEVLVCYVPHSTFLYGASLKRGENAFIHLLWAVTAFPETMKHSGEWIMKCGCVFVSGQRLCVPPSDLSWSVNLAQCRHVTPSSDQQHIVISSMEDVFFIIVQIFLSLSIVAGIALDMRQHQYSNIEYVHMNHEDFSHQKTLHRMPIRHAPKTQSNFKCLISIWWYSTLKHL